MTYAGDNMKLMTVPREEKIGAKIPRLLAVGDAKSRLR
jgi:hypothetical protein